MNICQAILERKSVREFQNKTISKDILADIWRYANLIPSAGGLYPLQIEVCNINKVWYAIICADFKKTTVKYGKRGIRYVYMEAGHAAQNISLICVEYGLGSCCIGAFDEDAIQKKCRLLYKPIYMVAIGYPK